jgi:hypothetical protein
MFRNIAVVAAAATIIIAASPAGAQSVSYGGAQYPQAAIAYDGSYGGNPGPYGGTAPVPYAYGDGAYYGSGLVTSDVALSGYYYGSEYGGPFSGPFRTDSAPLTGGGY